MSNVKQFQSIYKFAGKSLWFNGQTIQSDMNQADFHSLVLKTDIENAEFADVIFSKEDLAPIYKMKDFPIKTEIFDEKHATITTHKGLKFTFEICTFFTTQPKVGHIAPITWEPTKEDLDKVKACSDICKPSYFQNDKYVHIKFDAGKMLGLTPWTAIYFDCEGSQYPKALPVEFLPYMGDIVYHNDIPMVVEGMDAESLIVSELNGVIATCMIKHDLVGVTWERSEPIFHNQADVPQFKIAASKDEWFELANIVKGLTNTKNKLGLSLVLKANEDFTISATLRKYMVAYAQIPFNGVSDFDLKEANAFAFKPELLGLHLASMPDERITIEYHGHTPSGDYRPLKLASEFGFRIIMPYALEKGNS